MDQYIERQIQYTDSCLPQILEIKAQDKSEYNLIIKYSKYKYSTLD